MKIRNIDKNNDWTFGQSQSNYVRDAYAVILDIKLKLQEWYNDCYFDLTAGIDWKERLGSKNQKELLDIDIQTVVANVDGVLSINNFDSYVDNRHYHCSFSVYQQYSTQEYSFIFDSLNGGIQWQRV